MSLRIGVGGSKKAKTPLRNIKMVPYPFSHKNSVVKGQNFNDLHIYQQNTLEILAPQQLRKFVIRIEDMG